MKKFFSVVMAVIMLFSALPVAAFAADETVSPDAMNVSEAFENYGMEVTVGSNLYYIEDGDLYCYEGNGLPQTVDRGVTFVVEDNGNVYYSKPENYNTYIYKVGEASEIAKVFCPVECFDVDGEDVYYLYNGEVTRFNTVTDEETVIMSDGTIRAFYYDAENGICPIDKISSHDEQEESAEENEIQLQEVTLVKKSLKAVSEFYSNTELSGTTKVILYDNRGNPQYILSFTKNEKVSLLVDADYYTKGKKSEEWVSINFDSIGFLYAKKSDLANKFWTLTDILFKGISASSYTISSRYLAGTNPELLESALNVDISSAGTYSPKNEDEEIHIVKYIFATIGSGIVGFFKGLGDFFESIFGGLFASSNSVTVLGTVYNEGIYWYLLEDNTYVKKSEFDKYFKKVPGGSAQSVITFSSIVAPTGTIKKAGYPLGGTIRSNCDIRTITGKVINTATGVATLNKTVDVYAKAYSIAGSNLDYGLMFQYLERGCSYYLMYEVTDITGNTKTWKSGIFSVEAPVVTACQNPVISVSSIEEGQRVTVTNGDGSLIHVSANGRETTGYGTVVLDITSKGSCVVNAWATADGKPTSATVTHTVSVPQVSTPVISDAKYLKDKVQITVSGAGDIYYTANGNVPTKWSNRYTGPIYIENSATIKAMAASFGYVNSGVAQKAFTVKAPDAPVVKLDTADKVAQGKPVKVSWQKTERAYEYTAYLMKDGEPVKKLTTQNTSATFVLDEKDDTKNIEYTIKVVASNFKGNSADSNEITVMAMRPVKVTVVDRITRENGVDDETVAQIQQRIFERYGDAEDYIEGNVISVQKIDYDSKPSKPATPSKKGFDFAGYSEELYLPATEDTMVYAYYEVKHYTVSFYDSVNGKRELEPLSVDTYMYTESALEPTSYNVPYGYVFSGWNVDNSVSDCFDFKFVEGNMVLDIVYSWKNEELPVAVKIDGVIRDDKSYKVSIRLKNAPSTGTDGVQGRIITALYTREGKVVYTQIHDLDSEFLKETHNFDHSETITLAYTDNISYASVYVVGIKGSKTGGALSEEVTSYDISYAEGSQFWTEWSEWQEQEIVPTDEMQVRTEIQYRYRDKSTTTKTDTKTLDGWIYDKTTVRGTNGPITTTTYVAPVDDATMTRTVTSNLVQKMKPQWNFMRYWGYYGNGYLVCAYKSGRCIYYEETGWIDYPLPWESQDNFGGVLYDAYAPEGTPFDTRNGLTYYYGGYREIPVSWYEYTYTDTYYTHHFYKWSDYTDWSFVKPDSKKDREIETRTVYSYRTVTDNAHDAQEETVYSYNKVGMLDNITEDLAGEKATVLIYKKTNTDPTEEQIEYVSQIEIGEANTYHIIANTREVPHYQNTGDFVVTLALEGGEKLINVDYIKAPLPVYTVDFYCDGELYTSVKVEEGSAIDVNAIDIPSIVGKRFVKWDTSLVNITRNMTVNAVLEPEMVSVVFVDYENETIQIKEVPYGTDLVNMPAVEAVEGKTFSYWKNVTNDINITPSVPGTGGGFVTLPGMTGASSNIVKGYGVYEVVWDTVSYVVNFADLDGNIVDTQSVEYGKAAVLPEFVEKDGVVYMWDVTGAEWWNVTSDMYIYPYVPYESDVSAPTINVSTEDAGGTFFAELETAEEGGKIYYAYNYEITEDIARDVASEVIKDAEGISLLEETDTEETFVLEYENAIEIGEGTVIYAFVISPDGGISPISVFEFGYDMDKDSGIIENTYDIDPKCPVITIPDISVKPGQTVSVPVTIKNNPGIAGISLVVGYDMNNLKLTAAENGDVFEDAEFSKDIRADGSCKFTWTSDETVTKDGTIMTLTFVAGKNAGDYDITVSLDKAVDADEEEQPFATVDGQIKNEQLISGDVNGDSEVDVADAIRILKHDVGLTELTGDELVAGDVNGDGEVDFSDAILVLKFDVGLISSLGE